MRYKAVFVAGVATGYVLGAKAGRRRYEEIVTATRRFLRRPEVEKFTETARHEAVGLLGTAKRVATERLGGQDVTDRVTLPDSGITV